MMKDGVKMSRGKKTGIILMAAASLYLTACGSSFPEMTEEQNDQIVEYAAGLLLKYDKNNSNKLVSIPEEPETEAEEAEGQDAQKKERQKKETQSEVSSRLQEDPQEEPDAGTGREMPESQYASIEEFYGMQGVSVVYTGYELKDIYPDAETEEIFFAMKASSGNKLLVLGFDVENTGGEDCQLDMAALGAKFKVSVDGKTPRYALTTMLTDDFASYAGAIPAGASQSLVLVSEVPEGDAAAIQNISLIMKKGSEDAVISLSN